MQYLRFFTKKTFSTISPKHQEIHTMIDVLTGLKTEDPTAKQTILLLSFSLGGFLLPTSYEVRLTGHPDKSCPS